LSGREWPPEGRPLGALFLHCYREIFAGFEAMGANFDPRAVGRGCPLQIRLLALLGDGVIFGGADAVGVTSDQARTFVANRASFHKCGFMLSSRGRFGKSDLNLIMEIVSIGFIFSLAILAVSVVVHEVSHGYMAYILGDPTAKLAGRLTLNPIKHLDPVGSILVPLVLALLPGGLVFGWAKPVPYNPYNLKAGRFGPAYVAAAGPLSNISLAIFFGLLVRFGWAAEWFGPEVTPVLSIIVLINVMLALFNLIPVPPLDGSTILFSLLPRRLRLAEFFARYQLVLILVVIFSAGFIISEAVWAIYRLLTGL